MEAEQIEIAAFLKQYAPFKDLPEEAVDDVAKQVEIAYFRSGAQIYEYGQPIKDLCLVRSGAVEIYRRKGELFNRLTEGDAFGQWGLMMNRRVRFPAKAIEDSLVYFIPDTVFDDLSERFEAFSDFMEVEDGMRLRQAVENHRDSSDLTTSKVKSLILRDPVTIECESSVQQAAVLMTDEGVSSLLVMTTEDNEDGADQERIVGIITDRDLRTRVLAEGLPYTTSVSEILTPQLITLDYNAYVFEAMLVMLRNNLHHLPILRHHKPIGVIALSDIVRHESQSSLVIVSSIFRQQTVDDLASLSKDVPACFSRMVSEDANSHMIGSAMSVIGRSFKQRLLELGEEELGPPPVPYCFLALGSMARDEQSVVTDQDNAMILDDKYDPNEHDEYFSKLATFVSDGLDRCGYAYCTGNIMATNPEWRKTRTEWEACFADWIDQPNPKSLLNSNIFFDLDGVYGATNWAETLKAFIGRRARRNNRFLACMARNALNRTPPLGFFKNFVMEQDGAHKNSINLKRRGTAPLADLIRVHALAVDSRSQNSFERLDDIIEAGILPKGRGEDLRDAMEFISMVRIRHQAIDVEQNIEPDNNIEPENLSDFERRNLKDAFQILSNAQKFLKYRYQPNRSN
ncbi:putative nucleotidyltransferase substrate binding domain-containing protein [Enterovibrio nigricans]|uniref:CBS domain-containing protein n=1 Tax=Enterovibrio nigricans DSM 22720 TaxID=1121868 RepID=A0A1T4VQL5_9GAMM|nr:putative nucleotidyltransferase substrate binding domain-containing protein [Enterovibrio nigricans]SKA67282.1 CBS domain-containing protein [Enterovibrio nigricans DSM 22720]